MSGTRIVRTPHPDDTTPKRQLDALAFIYRRAIEAYEHTRGGLTTASDARKEIENGSGTPSISDE
jgi:hypothetical protein